MFFFNRIYFTVKYLKPVQLYYQLKYRLIPPTRRNINITKVDQSLQLFSFPPNKNSISIKNNRIKFSFLNINSSFNVNEINFNYKHNGDLWRYNLNYFDWLNQKNSNLNLGINTLSEYYSKSNCNPISFHPYPASLRVVNAVKFYLTHDITTKELMNGLAADLDLISRRLEFHIMGNHLLENAFALFIGGIFLCNKKWTAKGLKLMKNQLNEQILFDGMHFERSPMYHMIIMERLLDTLNISISAKNPATPFLKRKAIQMIAMAKNWEDLDHIPMFNDSAHEVSKTLLNLLSYAKSLLGPLYPKLKSNYNESGFKTLSLGGFILIANVGSIYPNYQPGHSHANELTFSLFHKGAPVIVDTGVSTYENNFLRKFERSTKAHNCLVIGKHNSSDVWSSFRVGKRATVTTTTCGTDKIHAFHNGYAPHIVNRTFETHKKSIIIHDKIYTKKHKKTALAIGLIHFHPSVKVIKKNNSEYVLENILKINISGLKGEQIQTKIIEYYYADGFNNQITSNAIEYSCHSEVKIKINGFK